MILPTLSKSQHHQLNMYALAASAAGVGVLASAQAAEAKIVYTHAHHVISGSGTYRLDLNHDGFNDFQFVLFNTYETLLQVSPASRKNEILGAHFASALSAGLQIGPNSKFQSHTRLFMVYRERIGSTFFTYGPWKNVTRRYLGLKFLINGKVHYGWARLNVSINPGIATLTGYAYETISNKPIIAGKTRDGNEVETLAPASHAAPTPDPATLGLLAAGSPTLSLWRRKESAVGTQ